MIGGAGVIVIEDTTINNVANYFFSDTAGLLIAAGATGLYALSTPRRGRQPAAPRIRTDNLVIVAAKLILFVAVIFGAVIWANRSAASRSPSCS